MPGRRKLERERERERESERERERERERKGLPIEFSSVVAASLAPTAGACRWRG